MEAMLAKHHPGKSMQDLSVLADITKRAFENGRR
jgi:hypothetical protein